jgi:hypothetical protein
MSVLSSQQRTTLENAVKQARKVAELGATNALKSLAVNEAAAFDHMTDAQRALRNSLRSKARLLGDDLPADSKQTIHLLAYELAYETWHKMLFAKFLETNNLLIHPEFGISVSMTECEEFAIEEKFADKWEAAASYASKMLPAIFRTDDPLTQVAFATEDCIKLESLIDALDAAVFTADDALGWVYQFWQSEAKAVINASGDKIDGAKLPAVTQLFTEPYMVNFLIDNTLGAWWVSRNPDMTPPVKFDYLRLLADGTPAAGAFEGWPDTTAKVTSLDPCMGSGHFVAALFPIFAELRCYEEGLTKAEATDKVIAENLHGLELDARCTQIAAFNLALTAWKYCGAYKILPDMNLACSGIAPTGKKEDWVKLVGNVHVNDKGRMENGMRMLYDHFQLAPELGSLLDPSTIQANTFIASFDQLQPVLLKALDNEADTELLERGVLAAGIAKAGELLGKKYTLIMTNVPYLSRGKQGKIMADYCEKNYPEAKGDLATVFLNKMLKANTEGGISCSVIPQNWLFLTSYKKFREKLLKNETFSVVARLGAKSFQTPMWDFNVMLITIQHKKPKENHKIAGFDVSEDPNAAAKDDALKVTTLKTVRQAEQLENPDARVVFDSEQNKTLLSKYAKGLQGISPADLPHYGRNFWELEIINEEFCYWQSTIQKSVNYGGTDLLLWWSTDLEKAVDLGQAYIRGEEAWGKKGIVVRQVGDLPISIYTGEKFDTNCAIISPHDENHLSAIWCFCSSDTFKNEVRKIDQKLNVTNATLVKVPFDLEHWQKVAAETYPNGLPAPYSADPTQWLFHGHPMDTDKPLQVAMARLLGYRWPAESDAAMDLSAEARGFIEKIKDFDAFTDDDGIFCLPSVNGEAAASDRLRDYLQAVFGDAWHAQSSTELLTKEGATAVNLEEWLRKEFFAQHCRLFQNRPFIWHIWDGRADGFSALVNYHTLDKANLSKLIYAYLGDWIRGCESKKKAGESGAEGLLSAAVQLKSKLEKILEGETPYDIFVRWKPLAQQPLGWEPDLNDGVRLNIRPFVEAGVLRNKFNVKWGIDRGKNPPDAPWGDVRDNDRHLSLAEKQAV